MQNISLLNKKYHIETKKQNVTFLSIFIKIYTLQRGVNYEQIIKKGIIWNCSVA